MTQYPSSIAPDVEYWTKSLIYLFGIGSLAYIILPSVYTHIDSWNPFGLVLPVFGSKRGEKMNVLRRKKKTGKYTVGLTNRANDCFANSNIQALAAVPELVQYLRELTGAAMAISMADGYKNGSSVPLVASSVKSVVPEIPTGIATAVPIDVTPVVSVVPSEASAVPPAVPAVSVVPSETSAVPPAVPAVPAVPPKSPTATAGAYGANLPTVTPASPIPLLSIALLQMIKELNQPILAPKTLSPWTFLVVLEKIYKSRISRNQHDAHELLHLILETLQNEYESVLRAGRAGGERDGKVSRTSSSGSHSSSRIEHPKNIHVPKSFAFAGSTIDRITCSRCGYSPPVTPSAFVVLSLMVPQKRSAALTELLDGLSSPEYIQDYGCQKCRLNHACLMKNGEQFKAYLEDPSKVPPELEAQLPKNIVSPIAKSTKFHQLPRVLAIHLSRSIYGGFGASRNSCKVSTKECITLVEQDSGKEVRYKLMAMIRHKGTHQMGHYECFRRKNLGFWKDNMRDVEEEQEKEKAWKEQQQKEEGQIPIKGAVVSTGSSASTVSTTTTATTTTTTKTSSSENAIESLSTTPASTTPASSETTYSSSGTTETIQSPVPSLASDNVTLSSSSSSVSVISSQSAPIALSNSSPPSLPLPYPSDRSMPSPASLSTSEFASAEISITPLRAAENLLPPTSPAIQPNISPPSHHEWWKISDDKVWECTTKEVLREESGAYLLFYERLPY